MIFITIVLGSFLFFAPNIFLSYQGFLDWDTVSTNQIYIRDIENYSFYFVSNFGGEPLFPRPDFYLYVFNLFFSPLAWIIFLFGTYTALINKDKNMLFFIVAFFAFFAFFSFQSHFQVLRYAIEFSFLFLLVVAVTVSKIQNHKISLALISLLLIFSLFQSVVIINEHHFKGLSNTFSEIPENAKIFTSYLDPVIFYSNDYVNNLRVNNKFFSRFVNEVPEKEERIFYSNVIKLEEVKSQVDVVLVDRSYFDAGYFESEILKDFKKCNEIKVSNHTIFWFYAKNCDTLISNG